MCAKVQAFFLFYMYTLILFLISIWALLQNQIKLAEKSVDYKRGGLLLFLKLHQL